MNLAYADPPYLGQAKRHYKNDPSGIVAEEVDHEELIRKLLSEYDGWALSASSPSIPQINKIITGWEDYAGPLGIRMAVWVKPFCSWKPTHRVQYCWEPVFFLPVRKKGSKEIPSVRDFVSANITLRKGTHGAKPPAFCDWILDLIGYQSGDRVDDLFPGTGAISQAIERRERLP